MILRRLGTTETPMQRLLRLGEREDVDDKPGEFRQACMRGDRYRYPIDLR